MKNLTKNSKILCVNHNDFDGVSSSIILGNVFRKENITYRSIGYNDIIDFTERVIWKEYDYVFMVDVAPSLKPKSLDRIENLILLDHHETSKMLHDPSKRRFIDTSNCATVLVKKFCEKFFKIDLSYLDELTMLTNDYDLWILNDPRSRLVNDLFSYYWAEDFRKRFFSGDVKFNEEESTYLQKKKIEFNNIWKDLELFKLEDINGCFIQVDTMVNDFCHKILDEEGFNFVFCRNQRNGMVSLRSNDIDIHIGNIAQKLKYGGGHKFACGLNQVKITDIDTMIQDMSNEINKVKGNINV